MNSGFFSVIIAIHFPMMEINLFQVFLNDLDTVKTTVKPSFEGKWL
jgi:hypothetical protein